MKSTDGLEKGKISSFETLLLLFTLVVATAILFVPGITAGIAGPDGWISLITVATFWGILVALVMLKLGNMFPGKTMVQYNEDIMGKWLGKIVSLLYIFWFIATNAVILREFIDFLLVVFLPETPITAFALTAILLSAVMVRGGIEVIARVNLFISPILLSAFIFISILEFGDYSFENLTPVMENGLRPILAGSITPMGWRGEIILMVMFLPFLNKPKQAKKITILAVVGIGIFLAMNAILVISVFGVEVTAAQSFPTFVLASYIEIGQFFQRLEAFIMLMWVTGVIVKISIFHYVASLATAQVFGLKDYKPTVIPIGLITVAWSVTFFSNITELKDFLGRIWPYFAFGFELFIPLALLLVALVRKKDASFNIANLHEKRGKRQ